MSFFKQGAKIDRLASTAMNGGTTTLLNTSEPIQDFTGVGPHTMELPDATMMAEGQAFEAINSGTGTLTVQDADANVVGEVEAGQSRIFRCVDTSTSAGEFDVTSGSGGEAGLSDTEADAVDAAAAGSKSEVSTLLSLNPEELGGDFWRALAGSITSKSYGAAAVLNGFFYSFGGYNGGALSINERLDNVNNYWISRANLPAARQNAEAKSAEGFAFVVGGDSSTSNNYRYTDATNAWDSRVAPPSARGFPGGFALADRVHIFHGIAAGYTDDTHESYDNTTNTWQPRAKVPYAARSSRGAVSQGFGFAISGTNAGGPIANTARYNGVLDSWRVDASLVNGTHNHACFESNGFLYACGGEKNPGPTYSTVIEEYSIEAGAWKTKANMPMNGGSGRQPTGANLDGFGITTNGTDSGSPGTVTEVYHNAAFFKTLIVLKALAVPTSISVGVAIKGLGGVKVPVRVRTDGDSWEMFQAGGSPLKLNEVLAAKFIEWGHGYVAGGSTGGASIEKYDDVANLWTSRQSMSASRNGGQYFALEGKGYAGGDDTGPDLSTFEQYDELKNAWVSKASFSYPTHNGNAWALNGFGYRAGGYSGIADIDTAEKYNPSTNTWSPVTAIPTARRGNLGFSLLNHGYEIGGSVSNQVVNSYSDITNTWTPRGSTNAAKYGAACFDIAGYGYAGGNTSFSAVLEKYSPDLNSWANKASFTSGAYDVMAFRFNGHGYVVGGYNGSDLALTRQYNDAADIFTNKANLNTARSVSSGNFTPGPYRNYEVQVGVPAYYVLGSQIIFYTRANMPVARNQSVAAYINGRDLATGNGSVNVDVYDREQNVWRAGTPAASALYRSAGTFGGFGYFWGGNALTHARFNFETNTYESRANSNETNRLTLTPSTYKSLNGFGLIHGGGDVGGTTTYPSLEQYNKSTNAWATKASRSNTSVNYSSAMVIGGFYTGLPGMEATRTTSSTGVDRYNDAQNAWSVRTVYPITSSFHGIVETRGRAFSIGAAAPNSANSYEYLFDLDFWKRTTDYPTATGQQGGTSSGLLSGGGNGPLATAYQLTQPQKEVILGVSLNVS